MKSKKAITAIDILAYLMNDLLGWYIIRMPEEIDGEIYVINRKHLKYSGTGIIVSKTILAHDTLRRVISGL